MSRRFITPITRNENGVSLIELLVSIVITGIVSVGLLGALTTLSVSSDRVRKLGTTSSTLNSAADALAALPYSTTCPPFYTLAAPAGVPPADASQRVTLADVAITDVKYWDVASTTFGTTCTAGLAAGDPRRLQRITLTVDLADGRATRSLQVVKRG